MRGRMRQPAQAQVPVRRPRRGVQVVVDPVQQTTAHVTVLVRRLAAAIHQQVYANPGGLTPQQVRDALGEKAQHVDAILADVEKMLTSQVNPPKAVVPASPTVVEPAPAVEVTATAEPAEVQPQ